MIIRNDQMTALESASRERFIAFMRQHLQQHFPEHCRALGDGKLPRAIEGGIQRAGRHGIVSERDVCKFIDLQFAFGYTFDTDGTQPWAMEVLANPAHQTPTQKVDALMSRAQAHLAALQGRPGAR